MIRRIFLKSLIILILVSLPQIYSTNAYFTNAAVSSENTFTVGDWTPPESAVDDLDDYYNDDFEIDYEAKDFGSGVVSSVDLYYSYSGGDWQYLYTNTPGVSPASGIFFIDLDNLEGDGEYGFLTIAIDDSGNIEDDTDGDGVLQNDELPFLGDTFTMVDTTPPVTMLATLDTMAIANELLYNGGFENENLDGWTVDSNGSDHKVTTEDKKTGNYSALIGFKTAAPSAEPAFDSIKQNVSLPSWITSTLSFWYRLMTSDTVSGGFFDAIIKAGANEIKVAHDGWDDPEVLDTDLGWKNVTYQLNELKGENIEVQFKVTQPYENYQTWAYLDDVKLTAATNSANLSTPLALTGSDGGGSNNLNITYTLDGNSTTTFSGTLITLGTPGEHTLKYFSTDTAGNSETSKQATISATAAPVDFGVVINEFLPNPIGDDSANATNGEWVELYNNSTNSVNVDGWKLADAGGNQMIISAVKTEGTGTVIAVGGVLKVYRRGSTEFSGPSFIMNNDGDTVKLLKPDDSQIDSYSYTFTIEGKSFARDPDGTGGWKDPEAETAPETSPTPIPTIESSLPSTPSSTTTGEPESILTPTPTPSPSLEVFPTSVLEPSNTPSPTPTPLVELPADEFVKEPQAEELPQNQTSLPEEGNEINE